MPPTPDSPPDDHNPLLRAAELPAFAALRPEHIEPAVRELVERVRRALEQVCAADRAATWDDLVEPLQLATEALSRAWGMVGHLHSVLDTPELRAAYNDMLPLVTQVWTELGADPRLNARYEALHASPGFATLDPLRRRIVEHALRDFRLSGAQLQGEAHARFADIEQRSAELEQMFSEHLLDATDGFSLRAREQQLAGLPDDVVQAAREAAGDQGGWLFTLHQPSYVPVMQHARDRELREAMYRAYVTRASELGDARLDNSKVMAELLALRHEQARLLGFQDFAELSLQPKMADSPDQVEKFLLDLARRARPHAERDLRELREFAASELGLPQLQAWDMAFASERLRERRYDYSEQELREYFTEPQVLQGLFELVQRLFGVRVTEQAATQAWHPDVRLWRIEHADGSLAGHFYTDLYARAGKRGGAWMDDARSRWLRPDGALQTPVALLTCNFAKGVAGRPALLSHDDVQTLFHEFGHGLHHLLTRVDELAASGLSGVEWDAVELPSQFLENFCWEWEVLRSIGRHAATGEALPRDMFDRMLAARNFQAGMQTLRQVEFSLFDLRVHRGLPQYTAAAIADVASRVRDEVAVVFPPDFARFQHSFSHIFAGGYAAGYYSYKWAEVLSADAFAQFEEHGVFDPDTGARFRDEILARGGSRDALESFRAFRGRDPSIDALLRHQGMAGGA
ncbi:MAG: M3 family metallopeptidase [Betaproteobacteria bacterium]|nr:M3 family metallopeptidase [Betaproteobacteria bacterium]